jgi:hypothetical protein
MPDDEPTPYRPPIHQDEPASQQTQPGHSETENPVRPGQPVVEEKYRHEPLDPRDPRNPRAAADPNDPRTNPRFASSAPTADPTPPGEHPAHAPVGERVDLGPINARLDAIAEKLDQLLEKSE